MGQIISRWAVLIYLATMPWASVFVSTLSGHDFSRIFEVIVCTICGLCLAFHLWRFGTAWSCNGEFLLHRWSLALLSAGILAIASTAVAPVITRATQELSLILGLVAASFVFATTHSDADIRLVSRAIVTGVLGYNLLTIVILGAALLHGYGINVENLPLGYANRRFFNHVQTVSLPLLATTLHRRTLPPREAGAAWAALVFGFSLLLLTGGRGTLLALVSSAFLSALWLNRLGWWLTIRPLAIGLLVGAALSSAVFIFFSNRIGVDGFGTVDVVHRLQDSSPARQYLWSLAIHYIYESPWLGVGPMHFAYIPNMKAAHPHNVYLQIAAEWGMPLLLLVLAGSLVSLQRLIRLLRCTTDPVDRRVGGSLILACVAVCVDGFVSGNFVMPVSQVWIAACFGMTAQWFRRTSGLLEYQPRFINWLQARLISAILILMMLVQGVLLIQDIGRLEVILKQSEAIAISERRCPRYWIDGWIVER